MKKNIVDEKERLLKLLSGTKANTLDVLYTVYQEFLKNSENPVEFFRIVLEYSEKNWDRRWCFGKDKRIDA